ncbi:hemerythrin domain-containing protein [Streptomyces sp. A3M-1-3]|uniref:hemerythrin domain-containing protein n=1 Tax=Streptomyces sp. A3M-1-3 TaxID=2962044 RepID=UPI0020B7B6B8|nr:hemerythrin domain-containing protein [Streptomyces sp. A3M-1-3]MCP3819744.1 hemerythrin domain-containing protein [Streptomyces sp. A3M-1-3]
MGHGGNVIAELTADHREVDALFTKIESRPPGDPMRRELADELTMELVRHSVAEEEHLYPAVRRFVDDGDDIADKEIDDHGEVERMLKELEDCRPDDASFDALISRLKSAVTAHVADEENQLFPLLADACSAESLQQLGEKVRAGKESAPTRPHPSAPDTPPANKLLAPGLGMVDRARDMLTGRGKKH